MADNALSAATTFNLLSAETSDTLNRIAHPAGEMTMQAYRTILAIVPAAFLIGSPILTSADEKASAAGSAEQAVSAAEHQWLKSQQTNNVALLAPLLADKVVETDAEGKVFSGKEAVLADAKSITWSSADYPDLKVTVFGRTAIAIGTFTGKGRDAADKSRDLRDRFTDTWVKMPNGKWQCVATHTSPLKS